VTDDTAVHHPSVPVTMPHCPICSEELILGSSGALDQWACPEGHGMAMTLSESYERLQEDEIALLWDLARDSSAGPLPSPFDGAPMKRVSMPYDEDETDASGLALGFVELDVDVANQFIWFDSGELDQLPEDQVDPEPTPEELAKVAEIASQFGAAIVAAAEDRADDDLSERFYRRVARNPETLHALDKVGRSLTAY
jgi:Zn-finger nucleic acid-binding protein